MKEASELREYSCFPWMAEAIEDKYMTGAVNGIVAALKDNHIKRNQIKQIFSLVDMVVNDSEI